MTKQVKSGDWKMVWKKTGLPVYDGATVTDRDGDQVIITGGDPPRHEASSGRIWVRTPGIANSTREYFPHVFDCEWRKPAKRPKQVRHQGKVLQVYNDDTPREEG